MIPEMMGQALATREPFLGEPGTWRGQLMRADGYPEILSCCRLPGRGLKYRRQGMYITLQGADVRLVPRTDDVWFGRDMSVTVLSCVKLHASIG
jgi:hypothetical protein